MKSKWLNHWLKHCELICSMSKCIRGRVGAIIIDENNNPVSAGFNGPPRNLGLSLCGVNHCERDTMKIKSGTRIEIGCYHAEMNAIANAAKKGVSLDQCTLIVNCNPCLICAKVIHHSGIKSVGIPKNSNYDSAGIDHLIDCNVKVIFID